MAYLDDQNGRPVQQKFLDLLPLKPLLKEEVHNALHKIPEMKLRPEKIPEEEDVVKLHSWKNFKDFPYLDAVPSCMLHVDIRELSTVNIDWKMLTLDRPETALDIQIFSRMVYLDKLMLKCVVEEKEKKAREKYIRLRTKGRPKPPVDNDVDKSDEFTYDYFSRFFGGNERAQAMEEVPKSATEDKSRPPTSADVQQVNKTPVPPKTRRSKRLPVKKKLRKAKRKKKRKKAKLRKRKLATKPKLKVGQKVKKFIPPLRKPKKSKTTVMPKKKVANLGSSVKKKSDINKTLVQMLKASEAQDRRERRKDSSKKSEV